MTAETHRIDPEADKYKKQFLEKLTTTQEWLIQEGIEYRIVGSLAVAAYTDRQIDFNRPGAFADYQRVPDIDIITPRDRIEDIKWYHNELLKADFPVFLGIVPAIAEIDFRHEEQYSYLRHKDLSIPIRSSTFEAQQRGFEDTEITTVNPMTLRGLYGNGAWLNKVKDREVRESLTEVIKESWPHDPADYEPFDEYIRKRREQYPGFLMGKYVLEKMLSALPTKAENTIRHYGARAFIQGNVISLLEYKPT